jgi:HlyD family secretion protein
MAKFPFKTAIGAVGAALVLGGALMAWNAHKAKRVTYVTAPVERGSIRRTIAASGSVNPEITVQVGAFVSGTIKALNCDYNTPVKKGQVCATIDPRPYQLAADQARAALGSGHAQLAKDRAGLEYATVSYNRMALLLGQDSISRDAVDNARALRDEARAQIALDQAANVQKQAVLDAAQVNLGYTAIVSPVDGVVVSRNVTVGQTVASSFQTPTLFLIAKDLTRMQVDTNVSESDIAGAVAGSPATFTVTAFPGRTFHGSVAQVRQAPISVQNVITYDVVVAADNPDLLLKPGMTANARIITAERSDVLRVPLQALSYAPAATPAAGGRGRKPRTSQAQQLWIVENGQPKAVAAATGLDDDAYVEIKPGALKAGDQVIVSASRGTGQASRARSPAAAPVRLGR